MGCATAQEVMTASSSSGSEGDAPDYLAGLKAVLDPASSESSSGTGAGAWTIFRVLVFSRRIMHAATRLACRRGMPRCCILRQGSDASASHCCAMLAAPERTCVACAESATTRASSEASGPAMHAVLTALEGLSREVSRLRVRLLFEPASQCARRPFPSTLFLAPAADHETDAWQLRVLCVRQAELVLRKARVRVAGAHGAGWRPWAYHRHAAWTRGGPDGAHEGHAEAGQRLPSSQPCPLKPAICSAPVNVHPRQPL